MGAAQVVHESPMESEDTWWVRIIDRDLNLDAALRLEKTWYDMITPLKYLLDIEEQGRCTC